MLQTIKLERNTYQMFNNDIPVARLYWFGSDIGMKVHMYTDNYEFNCDSIDTATKLIKIRWERPKEWN